MQQTTLSRKVRIQLSDYDYKSDIKYRLFLAELTPFQTEVLHEVLDNSLSFKVGDISDFLEIEDEEVIPVLDLLAETQLLSRDGQKVSVNKDKRRYFSSQLARFGGATGLEFFQGILQQVPIHAIPTWYSIPRTSDDIFSSLIERYLETPRTFERYLNEITFDNEALTAIAQDVFDSPDLKVNCDELMSKYDLTREALEELLVQLELNMVCCLRYENIDGRWHPYVAPFDEWRNYLTFQDKTAPVPLSEEESENIIRKHKDDFGFVRDLNATLNLLSKSPIPLKDKCLFSTELIELLSKSVSQPFLNDHLCNLTFILKLLHLIEITDDQCSLCPETCAEWLEKPLQEQAMSVYLYSLNHYRDLKSSNNGFTDRDIREIEKSLKRVLYSGWVSVSDFLKGMTVPIKSAQAVFLEKKGKTWRYSLPLYTEEEKAFIKKTLFNRLFNSGMVAVGLKDGCDYFIVTPFGRMSLGD